MTHLQAGEIFEKRYQIVKQLGVGGMGAVYRAKQIDAAYRDVAIKLISETQLDDPEMAKRMLRESKLLSQLQHKNIMTIFGISLDERNAPYMIAEFIRGKSLREIIEQDGPMPWRRALDLTMQACAGMSAAHKLGIIHRDLKPENLMLLESKGGEDHLKIIDFGLSFSAQARLAESQRLTATGCLVGSSNYMSPEQITGQSDERSDIYALGCILFELLSGEKLFDAETSVGVLYLQTNEEPWKRFTAIKELVPVSLFKLLERVLAKSVNSRPQSAELFQDELRSITQTPNEYANGQEYLQSNKRFVLGSSKRAAKTSRLKLNHRAVMALLIVIAILIPTSIALLNSDRTVQKKAAPKKVVDDEKLAQIIANARGKTYRGVFDYQIYRMTKGTKYNKYGYLWLRSVNALTWYITGRVQMPYTAMSKEAETADIVHKRGLPPVNPSERFDVPDNADPLSEFWLIRTNRIICLQNLDQEMSANSMLDMLEDKEFGFAPDWCYTIILPYALQRGNLADPQQLIERYSKSGADINSFCHSVIWRLLILNRFEEADKLFKRYLSDEASTYNRILRARIDLGLGQTKRAAAKKSLQEMTKNLENDQDAYKLAEALLDANMIPQILEMPSYKNIFGTAVHKDGAKKSASLKKMLQLDEAVHANLDLEPDDFLNAEQRMEIHKPENERGAALLSEGLHALKNTSDPIERCRLMCFLSEHSFDWTNPMMQSYAFWLCKRNERSVPRELRLRCAILYGEINQYNSLRQRECLAALRDAINDIEKNGYPEHTDYGVRINEAFAARARLDMFSILLRLQDKTKAKIVLEEMIAKNQAHYFLDRLYASDPVMLAPYFNSELSKVTDEKAFLPICLECMRVGRREQARAAILTWQRRLIEKGVPTSSEQFGMNKAMAALLEVEFKDYFQAKTILLQFKGDNKVLSEATRERLDFAREIVLNP